MEPVIQLAEGAEENGLAIMLADLVRQNLEAKPRKKKDFDALAGTVSIVAEDADVALTLRFERGKLTLFDGIVGIPDVAVRGSSDAILALSNFPLTSLFSVLSLPLPLPNDKEGIKTLRSVMNEMRSGKFRVYGMAFHMPLLMRLTRVMSVNG